MEGGINKADCAAALRFPARRPVRVPPGARELLRLRAQPHGALPSGQEPIIGCRRSLQANSDLFSWRCRVARRPIRENAIRTQTGGTRGSPRDLAPASSRRPPNGHMGPFSLLHRSPDFQHFVDYGIAHTSLHRRSMPPVTAGSHGRRGGVVLGNSR
jgi:hypothetical protein